MALNPQTLAMAFWRRTKRIPQEGQQPSTISTTPTRHLLQGIEIVDRSDAPRETQPSQEHQNPISSHDCTGTLHDRIRLSASFRTWTKIDSYCAENADKEVWIELKELNRERQERFQRTLKSIKPIYARGAVVGNLPIKRVEEARERD